MHASGYSRYAHIGYVPAPASWYICTNLQRVYKEKPIKKVQNGCMYLYIGDKHSREEITGENNERK